MRSSFKWWIRLLCMVLAVSLFGCTEEPEVTEPSVTETVPLDVQKYYEDAVSYLQTAKDLILNYSVIRTRTLGGETYTEKITGTASFQDLGSEAFLALVEEKLTYGTVSGSYLEYYDGGAFVQMSGCTFTNAMSPEAFQSRHLPALLLNAGLYGNAMGVAEEDRVVLYFRQPGAPEAWAGIPKDAKQFDAQGSITVSPEGALLGAQYSAGYTWGETVYDLQVQMELTVPQSLDLREKLPQMPETCVPLANLDVPKLLMRASGDIYTAKAVTAQTEETIFSAAVPMTHNRKTVVNTFGAGDSLAARLEYVTRITDYRDQITETVQTVSFMRGLYTMVTDNQETEIRKDITPAQMRTACKQDLLGGLMALVYIADVQVTETEDTLVLEFQCNDYFTSALTVSLDQILKMDLDANADSYTTNVASGYLELDKTSGLPVGMGMEFSRTHVFGSVPYELSYRMDQVLTLSSADAYRNIFGE